MINKIEILKTELAKPEYAELVNVEQQNYPAIAQLLNNKPSIPNPVPQEAVWKCPTILELFGAITPTEAIELYKIPWLVADIRTSIDLKNQANLQAYFLMIQALVSAESQANLQALLTATQLDPSYQSQIPGQSKAEELGIYPVNEIDVQGALN